eukprot:10175-Chlamydomonas_euryale.AAC.8
MACVLGDRGFGRLSDRRRLMPGDPLITLPHCPASPPADADADAAAGSGRARPSDGRPAAPHGGLWRGKAPRPHAGEGSGLRQGAGGQPRRDCRARDPCVQGAGPQDGGCVLDRGRNVAARQGAAAAATAARSTGAGRRCGGGLRQ